MKKINLHGYNKITKQTFRFSFNDLIRRNRVRRLGSSASASTAASTFWGKSKRFKSFWTLNAMCHVARGAEYRDRRVRQGTVIYCVVRRWARIQEADRGYPALSRPGRRRAC